MTFWVSIWTLTTLAIEPAGAAFTVGIEDFAVVSGGNARMTVMTTDPAGRLFVGDQNGRLLRVDRDSRGVTTYLDLADPARSDIGLVAGGERGFQSFAFHPDFDAPGTAGFGKLYTIHSDSRTNVPVDFDLGTRSTHHTVLLEWTTSDPGSGGFVPADPANPFREVLRLNQPLTNHNAGQIAFNPTAAAGDPDRGNLYVGVGDGGGGNDPFQTGQDASNPYGAILRIDPLGSNAAGGRYGIVADNAFASDGDPATLAEIAAIGLRNPQRFGWDSQTGDLYIADIGQGAFEEINRIEDARIGNGLNFGWQDAEGLSDADRTDLTDPIAAYPHEGFVTDQITGGRAITVGEVVRDGPPELDGVLLLGDFPNGIIYTLDVEAGPLDGTAAGLEELIMVDESGDVVRLIDLIRDATGNNDGRADLRFSYAAGDVFILNKRDNVIRRLTSLAAIPEPSSFGWMALFPLGSRRRRRR